MDDQLFIFQISLKCAPKIEFIHVRCKFGKNSIISRPKKAFFFHLIEHIEWNSQFVFNNKIHSYLIIFKPKNDINICFNLQKSLIVILSVYHKNKPLIDLSDLNSFYCEILVSCKIKLKELSRMKKKHSLFVNKFKKKILSQE